MAWQIVVLYSRLVVSSLLLRRAQVNSGSPRGKVPIMAVVAEKFERMEEDQRSYERSQQLGDARCVAVSVVVSLTNSFGFWQLSTVERKQQI